MGYRCRLCSQCPAPSVAYSRYVMPVTTTVCMCIDVPDEWGADGLLLYDLATRNRYQLPSASTQLNACHSMGLIVRHNGCVQHRLSAIRCFFDSCMIHGGNDKPSLSKIHLLGDSQFCLCVPRQVWYIQTSIKHASTPTGNKKLPV